MLSRRSSKARKLSSASSTRSGSWLPKKEDFLPYEMGYLTEALRLSAERELRETEEKKEEALELLRQKIAEEKNFFPRTEEIFLLQFLRARKFNVTNAFKNLQSYYKFRKKYAYIYDSDTYEPVHAVFQKNFLGFLPYRERDGAVIGLVKLGKWDPAEVSRDLLLWVATCCVVYSLEDPATQVAGFSMLIDMRGVGRKHYRLLNRENIMLVYNCLQYAFPGRVKSVHLIGLPPFFNAIWNIIYPFLFSSKLKKRVFMHGENLKSLHKHIPQCILPSEYGGELGPFDNSAWHAKVSEKDQWGLSLRQYGYRD